MVESLEVNTIGYLLQLLIHLLVYDFKFHQKTNWADQIFE